MTAGLRVRINVVRSFGAPQDSTALLQTLYQLATVHVRTIHTAKGKLEFPSTDQWISQPRGNSINFFWGQLVRNSGNRNTAVVVEIGPEIYQSGRGGRFPGTNPRCCAQPLNTGSKSWGNDNTKSTSMG